MPYLVSYSMTKVLPEIEAYGNMKWPTVAKKNRMALSKSIYGHNLNNTFLKMMPK